MDEMEKKVDKEDALVAGLMKDIYVFVNHVFDAMNVTIQREMENFAYQINKKYGEDLNLSDEAMEAIKSFVKKAIDDKTERMLEMPMYGEGE